MGEFLISSSFPPFLPPCILGGGYTGGTHPLLEKAACSGLKSDTLSPTPAAHQLLADPWNATLFGSRVTEDVHSKGEVPQESFGPLIQCGCVIIKRLIEPCRGRTMGRYMARTPCAHAGRTYSGGSTSPGTPRIAGNRSQAVYLTQFVFIFTAFIEVDNYNSFPQLFISSSFFFLLATPRSLWDLSAPARDRTCALGSGSSES